MTPITIQRVLQQAKAQLASICEQPGLEAELLLAHALNQTRSHLYAWPDKELTQAEVDLFASYLARRCRLEPLAYITGHREFWSLDLSVTPDTLIPRPDTELIVMTALALFPQDNAQIKVADLGTGSGAIAVAMASERRLWQIYATDISESALQIAGKNAHTLGFLNISFYHGNWCTALPSVDFDMIVSNPPYIAETEWQEYVAGLQFEPRSALVAGQDGLRDIREISQSAINHLRPGGYLLVEHGFLQGEAVRDILAAYGYCEVRTVRDLANNERVTVGRYHPR
jgi:release factor glutamine methyltransferase